MAEKNTNTKQIPGVNLDYGKMPPQALELEEAVLGAVMLEKDAVISVMDILKPESFYSEAHQKIFAAILSLSSNHKPVDILTVTDELRNRNELEEVGGPFYITQLTSRVASAANLEYHAHIVAQKHIQRELIRVSSEIQKKAYDDSMDVDDLLDFSEKQLFDIAEGNVKKQTAKLDTIISKAIKQIEEAGQNEDNLSGVPSGFTSLDRLTSGWQRSDLVIIASRPSMGKTAFVLSMARNTAVEHKRGVAIFSLEMSDVQLVNRLLVAETELSSEKIRNGNLKKYEWEQLDYKIKNLVDAPIFIDDTPALSIFEFRAKARRLKANHDIDLIFVDYLQLMTGAGDTRGNREQEVSVISRSLKAVAKELDVPIIALSQLNRSVETRSGNKRPQLSDLRESGAIEQDADLVLFIHRPEKYGFTEDEDGNSLKNLAEIIVAKHRNGALGDVPLKFRDEYAKYTELDDPEYDVSPDSDQPSAITYGSKMNQESDDSSGNENNNDGLDIGGGIEFSHDDAPF
jgi:replicative DNA helicase